MPISTKFIFAFLFLTLTNNVLFGQQSQIEFGKNRIQYKNFKWQYISTYNFDIYYYEGGKELAQTAANYAEIDFKNIVDQISFTPYSKTKLIIYNSVADLQQSNIGLDTENKTIGGETNFVKSHIEVAYNGNQNEFRHDIRLKISEMLINIMLYGGSLKEIVQSSYLLTLPDWYVKGAAAFIAEGWNIEMDNYLRSNFINKKKYKNPAALTGKEAIIVGQSIWNFINERYGKMYIGNILNLTRILRNEESSIESNLAISYSSFIKQWNAYYLAMPYKIKNEYSLAEPGKQLTTKKYRSTDYKNIYISPVGDKIAYIKSRNGKYKIYIQDLVSGKNKRIYKGGIKRSNQQEDKNSITGAWQSPEIFAFIEKKKNKTKLLFYNINTEKISTKPFNDFNQILSFSFSEDGKRMVLSGDKKGRSDIYLYDIQNNSFKQITNDLYDDIDPSFVKSSYSILFSSNRVNDTISKNPNSYRNISGSFNIFLYQSNNSVLKRITDYSTNIKPRAFDKNNIIYLSDEKGIFNLYKLNLTTDSITQISNFLMNVDDYDINSSFNALAFTSLSQKRKQIYYYPGYDFNTVYNTTPTDRQKKIEEKKPKKVPVKILSDTSNAREISDDEIDINNYFFESDVKDTNKTKTAIKNPEKPKPVVKDEIKFKGPSKYQNDFSIEKVNSTLMIDPLRGLGILMEAKMGDVMGNHKLNAGIFGLTDLKSSTIFGEYLYLKKRVDFKVRYDRSSLFIQNEIEIQRYTLNKMSLRISYPFNNNARISLTPNAMSTRYTNLNSSNVQFRSKDLILNYLGAKAEFIYDNTSIKGINMIEGSRIKVSFEKNYNTNSQTNNFGKLILDFRNYLPIHKELIFATRFSYGQFVGNAKKNFLIGGMDNWLFNSTAQHGASDPLSISPIKDNSNLLFVEYVTSMRGFKYNTQYGNNFALFNAELRIPLVKYLYKGAITSSFLENFQIVGFTDIGTAWSGKSPFTTENSTNTTIVGGGSNPFKAKVINYRDPFLIGYGAGVRTLVFGYYVKFDIANAIEDRISQGRRFYLTLGYDF